MSQRKELILALIRKQELQILIDESIEEIQQLTYEKLGERFGKTKDSIRYFARKLSLTSGKIQE